MRLLTCVLVSIAFVAGLAFGQASAPSRPPGSTAVPLKSIDLTDEIASTKGRSLRLRKVTLPPGGRIELHSHKDRPAITYLLEGEMTYHYEGKPDLVLHPGEGFAEGKATTHWGENRGKVPAVWIAADIAANP